MKRSRWDDSDDPLAADASGARSRTGRRRSRRARRERTAEESAYRAAKRRAGARLGFTYHFIAYAGVCLLILLRAGFRPAFVTALAWGIGIAFHYFGAIVAPEMRRRFLDREVKRQVATDIPRERQTRKDTHVRSLEELSAQVAHEIRNPVTAAKSLVQQMGEDPASAENVGYAKVALEELDRVERSVAHLLRYAREEDLQLADLRLDAVIESALGSVGERIDAAGVRVVRDVRTEATLRGDAEKLRRVLINLINNAVDAMSDGAVSDPTLEIAAGENLAGTECWVRVRDNGPGIDSESLAQIWSPFFTSKESGTGLGLAISKKVVDAHGGRVEATSRPGEGAEFTIAIPKQGGRTSA